MQIAIAIKDAKLSGVIDRLLSRASDLHPAMADIAETLYTITDEAFDTERSPDGTAWADLAPATWRYKKTNKKLFEEGTLRGSLYADSSAHEARVSVNAHARGYPYAAVQQFGSKHVPARPFMPIGTDGALLGDIPEQLIDLLENYLLPNS